jgi:hypothetical protein
MRKPLRGSESPQGFEVLLPRSALSTASAVAASAAISASTAITAGPPTTSTAISATVAAAGASTAARRVVFARFFRRPALQHRLAAQANLALWVNVRDHDHQLVAQLGHILNFVDAEIGQL